MKLLKIICIILIIFSFACEKKYVGVVSPEYEGEWHAYPIVTPNTGTIIVEYFIVEGTYGEFGEYSTLEFQTKKIKRYSGSVLFNLDKSKFCIGKTFEGSGKVIFNIDIPPYINLDSNWECTLTERVYIKQ